MHAITLREPGGPEVLEWTEVPDPEPGPARISFGVVKRINNHVELTVRREDLENQELEVWVRDHVIAHIPGASHAPE